MPLIRNPIMPGNWVWECIHCEEVFLFVDEGKQHEIGCDGEKKIPTGMNINSFITEFAPRKNIKLVMAQVKALTEIFNIPFFKEGRGAGKSFLIRCLYEYDKWMDKQ